MTGGERIYAALTTGSPAPTHAIQVAQDAVDEKNPPPYIIFRRVSVERDRGLDDTLLSVKETFYVECWGVTRADSDDLEQEVVAALEAAGFPPDGDDPDGLDPYVKVMAAVISVPIWTFFDID